MKESIPAPVRRTAYWAFFVAAIVIGSIQTYIAATGSEQPEWITGALAVVAYASGALGLQAAIHVPSRAPEAPVVVEPVVDVMMDESEGRHFADAESDIPDSLK